MVAYFFMVKTAAVQQPLLPSRLHWHQIRMMSLQNTLCESRASVHAKIWTCGIVNRVSRICSSTCSPQFVFNQPGRILDPTKKMQMVLNKCSSKSCHPSPSLRRKVRPASTQHCLCQPTVLYYATTPVIHCINHASEESFAPP